MAVYVVVKLTSNRWAWELVPGRTVGEPVPYKLGREVTIATYAGTPQAAPPKHRHTKKPSGKTLPIISWIQQLQRREGREGQESATICSSDTNNPQRSAWMKYET